MEGLWYYCGVIVYSVIITQFPYIVVYVETLYLVGLPGVLFVLPDSYVDPEYKDYGGMYLISFSYKMHLNVLSLSPTPLGCVLVSV